jgi:hypothetical protein
VKYPENIRGRKKAIPKKVKVDKDHEDNSYEDAVMSLD